MSRLSQRHRVLFVETVAPDPQLAAPLARFSSPDSFPNITVLRLQFPTWRWQDGTYVDAERRRLVQEFVDGPGAGQFENPVQWFYDPMAVTAFGGQMGEVLTVYDCMDELSKFRGAPPEIIERERELLARADVVFTGGRKLFEAKRRFHNNCHYYGCGVDAKHFGRARAASTAVPEEMTTLKKPILGFFGVMDERMDYELLGRLAEAEPSWSIVIIGPAIKIEAAALPRRPNLHWLGQRAYADLPAFCKAFDVCLMPFALNEATEFINPTKALEYMATGRPIISTAVPDVVRNFGSVVRIASGKEDFVAGCREALDQPDYGAIGRGLEMAAALSWERIVDQLEGHLREARARKASTASHLPANPVASCPPAAELAMSEALGA
jgi:glycosyltransferase involved in cell wall biosynthesis